MRKTLVFEDTEGRELCKIQGRVLRVRDSMEIEDADGNRIAMVKKAVISPATRALGGPPPPPPPPRIQGTVLDHEYEIQQDGAQGAEVSQRLFRVRDTSAAGAPPPRPDAFFSPAATAPHAPPRRPGPTGRRPPPPPPPPPLAPTPPAPPGRIPRPFGSARASSASSAETPRIAASWPSGTCGRRLPVSAWLSGSSAVAAIARPSPSPIAMIRPASQRAIDRTWRGVPPTSRRSPSSRPRWSAIIASVLTTAIDVNAKMIATNSGPSQRLSSRSASVARGQRRAVAHPQPG